MPTFLDYWDYLFSLKFMDDLIAWFLPEWIAYGIVFIFFIVAVGLTIFVNDGIDNWIVSVIIVSVLLSIVLAVLAAIGSLILLGINWSVFLICRLQNGLIESAVDNTFLQWVSFEKLRFVVLSPGDKLLVFGGGILTLIALVFLITMLIRTPKLIQYCIQDAHKTYSCSTCKANFRSPIYECGQCRKFHKRLKPSLLGIYKKKCKCGSYLPRTNHKKILPNINLTPIRRDELMAHCPHCGAVLASAENVRHVGILLVGAMENNSEVYRFKDSLLYNFIEKEIQKNSLTKDLGRQQNAYLQLSKRYTSGVALSHLPSEGEFAFQLIGSNAFERMIHVYERYQLDDRMTPDLQQAFKNSEMGGVVLLALPDAQGKYDINDIVDRFNNSISLASGMKTVKGKYTIPVIVALDDSLGKIHVSNRLNKLKGIGARRAIPLIRKKEVRDLFAETDFLFRGFLTENNEINHNALTILDRNFVNLHFCSFAYGNPKENQAEKNVVSIAKSLLFSRDPWLKSYWGENGNKGTIPVRGNYQKLWSRCKNHYETLMYGEASTKS